MSYQAFEKASHRLLDSVWTVTFRKVSDFSVEVFAYKRDDQDGYDYEALIPTLEPIENENRFLTHIVVNDETFVVENQKYIFNYL